MSLLSQIDANLPRPAESLPLGSAVPLHVSPDLDGVATPWGERGAEWIGLDANVMQRLLWQLLEVRSPSGRLLYEESGVEVPRRSGKTDGIFAELVGRCLDLPGHVAVYCAQSGQKSRERYYSLLRRVRALHKDTEIERGTPTGDQWRSRESRGEEQIEFGNGSILMFRPPLPSTFRGDAIDTLVLDESQEHDIEETAGLLAAAYPVMDTRPDPQVIVAGTPAPAREGLLWDVLELGRVGEAGILEYAAPDGCDVADRRVWVLVHPGPAGVTAERGMEVLEARFKRLGPDRFGQEYLGLWPSAGALSRLTPELWAAAGTETVKRPTRFALAIDVAPDLQDAAIVAAWRTDGVAYIEVVEHQPGAAWVRNRALRLAREYRVAINYDAKGPVLVVADELALAKPRPKLQGLTGEEFATACQRLATDVIDGNLKHFRDPVLEDAVANAGRRTLGDRWAWSRKGSGASISALVAATVALRAWDQHPPAAKPRLRSAS